MEKLFIPSSVRKLGHEAFAFCKSLREVVFEPDSRLECIGYRSFAHCGLTEIVIPRSVETIETSAFCYCASLTSVRFEEGSRLASVQLGAFYNTMLERDDIKFP